MKHLFRMDYAIVDWIAAESEADARATLRGLIVEDYLLTEEDADEDLSDCVVTQIPDDEDVTVRMDGEDITKPAGEWAAEAKRPHVASSEW